MTEIEVQLTARSPKERIAWIAGFAYALKMVNEAKSSSEADYWKRVNAMADTIQAQTSIALRDAAE